MRDLEAQVKQGGTSASGGAVTSGAAASNNEAVNALREKMTSQYNSFKMEQQLISSAFHEIGLRYHQLLNEYKAVIKDTNSQDRLLQTKK